MKRTRVVHPGARDRRNPTVQTVRPLISDNPRAALRLLHRIQQKTPDAPGLEQAFVQACASLADHRQHNLRVYRSVVLSLVFVALLVLWFTGRLQFWPLPRTAMTPENAGKAVQLRTLREHDAIVWDAAYAPTDSASAGLMASCSADGVTLVWDGDKIVRSIRVPTGAFALAWLPDGSGLWISDAYGGLYLWQQASGVLVPSSLAVPEYAYCLSVSPDGRWLAAGTASGVIELSLDLSAPEVVYGLGDAPVQSLAYLPATDSGARTLALATAGREVYVARDGNLIPIDVRGRAVAFSGDGTALAVGGDETVTTFDAHTLEYWRESSVFGGVSAISYSPDGSLIVVGTSSGLLAEGSSNPIYALNDMSASVGILDAETGALLSQRTAHNGSITAIDWSPDGTTIAAASHDANISLRGLRW